MRNLRAIREMIMESGLPEVVKDRSIQVFTELGQAEAKTHGSTLDQVKVFVGACASFAQLDFCLWRNGTRNVVLSAADVQPSLC